MAIRDAPRPTRAAACLLAAFVCGALVMAVHYPGLIMVDSEIQLKEARLGVYRDWHPPLMGRVWSVLDRIAPGPIGMLALNNALFWSALALTVYLAGLSPFTSAAVILAIGLSPQVFSALGVIWKDVTLAALLLLAFALLWLARERASRVALLIALPLLWCAGAWRHNAAAAVLPLALWVPFIWHRIAMPQRRAAALPLLAAGLTLFVLLSGAAYLGTRLLTNGGRLYPLQQVLIHDLVAISVATGELHLPASLRTEGPLTLEGLRCVYTPESVGPLYGADERSCPLRIKKLVDAARMRDLQVEWLRAVVSEPRAYLAHRWNVFREQFAIGVDRVCYPVHVGQDAKEVGVEFSPTPLYRPALRLFGFAAYRTPLFRGWVYLLVASAVLLVGLRAGGAAPAMVLAGSGLLYGLGYLVVGSACPFRLHWWTLVSALTALVVLVGGMTNPRRLLSRRVRTI